MFREFLSSREVVHYPLVGELRERVETHRLRGGQLFLRDERLDLVRDRAPSCDFASQSSSRCSSGNLTASPQVHFASAEIVCGLDDRRDVLLARTASHRFAPDDGRETAIAAIATATLPIIPEGVRRCSGCHLDFVRCLMIYCAP